MNIYIGSQNPAKIHAVELAISQLKKSTDLTSPPSEHISNVEKIIGIDVPSHVSAQPMNDEETIQGAMNRAQALHQRFPQEWCIGLEGGVQKNSHGLFVCNWGVFIDEKGQPYIASGARVRLPNAVAKGIAEGNELGDMMDQYAQRNHVRKKEGAIGILTEGVLHRSQMFADVVLLLFGQQIHHSVSKI